MTVPPTALRSSQALRRMIYRMSKDPQAIRDFARTLGVFPDYFARSPRRRRTHEEPGRKDCGAQRKARPLPSDAGPARASRRGPCRAVLDIALVEPLEVVFQPLVGAADELSQRRAGEVVILVVDRLDAGSVDRQQTRGRTRSRRRHSNTNWRNTARNAARLSRRKSAMVLKSGFKVRNSQRTSMLRCCDDTPSPAAGSIGPGSDSRRCRASEGRPARGRRRSRYTTVARA